MLVDFGRYFIVKVIKMEKAIFMDLQGTLGGTGIDDIRNFKFYSNAIKAINTFKEKGYLVFILTNQSNIGRGMFSIEEFYEQSNKLFEGLEIDGVECCPHIEEQQCECKKPKTGMIVSFTDRFSIDLSESYVIGDMGKSDMVLAHNIGSKSILVLTGVGQGSLNEFRHTWESVQPTYIVNDIYEAAMIVDDISDK